MTALAQRNRTKGTVPVCRDLILTTVTTDDGELFMLSGRGRPVETFSWPALNAEVGRRLTDCEQESMDAFGADPASLALRVTWDRCRGLAGSDVDPGYLERPRCGTCGRYLTTTFACPGEPTEGSI